MEKPTPEEIAKWDRWFGVEMNNRAWTLAEQPELGELDREELLNAAHAAALHWGRVGTALNHARIEMLLGQVYARLGDGPTAMRHAQRSFDYVTTHESPDWEIAFAHTVLANAAHAANHAELHARHHGEAKRLGDLLPSAEDKEIFQRTFLLVPCPR